MRPDKMAWMRTSLFILFTKYSCDETKKNEMRRACDTHMVAKKCVRGFGGEISRKLTA
jgi:hypothetical protein